MAEKLREGDKVRITRGKYKGTVGRWEHGGVSNHYGYTGNCVEGVNVEKVPDHTPTCEVQHGTVLWTENQ